MRFTNFDKLVRLCLLRIIGNVENGTKVLKDVVSLYWIVNGCRGLIYLFYFRLYSQRFDVYFLILGCIRLKLVSMFW